MALDDRMNEVLELRRQNSTTPEEQAKFDAGIEQLNWIEASENR